VGVPIAIPTGIKKGAPLVSTRVPQTTVGSSPAPRAVWTTSSSIEDGIPGIEDDLGIGLGDVLDHRPPLPAPRMTWAVPCSSVQPKVPESMPTTLVPGWLWGKISAPGWKTKRAR